MKASELRPGMDYLHNRSRDWRSNAYTGPGYGSVQRVRPVTTEVATWVFDGESGFTRTYKGSSRGTFGILVYVLDPVTGERVSDRMMAVNVASLRGEWAMVWPEVQEAARIEREARETARAADRALADRNRSAILRLLAECGVNRGVSAYGVDQALITVEMMELIVMSLEIARADREC